MVLVQGCWYVEWMSGLGEGFGRVGDLGAGVCVMNLAGESPRERGDGIKQIVVSPLLFFSLTEGVIYALWGLFLGAPQFGRSISGNALVEPIDLHT
jgi:hypothetical protein